MSVWEQKKRNKVNAKRSSLSSAVRLFSAATLWPTVNSRPIYRAIAWLQRLGQLENGN